MNGTWFKIKGYKYTGPDTIEFSKPFDPPVQPHTWHFVKCVLNNSSGNDMTPTYEAKFEPVGQGKLEEVGIRALTKANVDSGQWIWKGRKKL